MIVRLDRDDLSGMVAECVKRLAINEGMTGVAYHFTNASGLRGILETGKFRLTGADRTYWDRYGDRRKYYMCVSRQKYGGTGYPFSKVDCTVRITLDGDRLNSRYKTVPYDYIGNGKRRNGRIADTEGNGGRLPYRQEHVESEDRLLSDSPEIPGAAGYILRIDFLALPNTSFSKDLFRDAGVSGRTFVYYGREDFNLQNRKCLALEDAVQFNEYVSESVAAGEDGPFEVEGGPDRYGFRKIRVSDYDLNLMIADKIGRDLYNLVSGDGRLLSGKWFTGIGDFNRYGIARVSLDGRMNIMDTGGDLLLGRWASWIEPYGDSGMSVVGCDGRMNCIRPDGTLLAGSPDDTGTWPDTFSKFNRSGLAVISKDGRYRVVGTSGESPVRGWLDFAEDFRRGDGTVFVQRGGRCNIVGRGGRLAFGSPDDMSGWPDSIGRYPVAGDLYLVKSGGREGVFNPAYGYRPEMWFDRVMAVAGGAVAVSGGKVYTIGGDGKPAEA